MNYMWSTRSILYHYTGKLNVNRLKKTYPANIKNKKVGVSILNKVHLVTKGFLSQKGKTFHIHSGKGSVVHDSHECVFMCLIIEFQYLQSKF